MLTVGFLLLEPLIYDSSGVLNNLNKKKGLMEETISAKTVSGFIL